jgi:uncharacterized protein (DUF2252 family)
MPATDDARTGRLVEVLTDAFSDLMAHDADAFRRKFRRMAADPVAFYRGSACVFYADVVEHDDPWADERTSRVWIQGDLHAENFGTYMDGAGRLVFDVNDFDEAYLGSFTWDLRRMAASVALMGRIKAVPDSQIDHLLDTYLRAYLQQVRHFVDSDRDHEWALTLDNAEGAVREALLNAQLSTRYELLEKLSMIEHHQRRFRQSSTVRELGRRERKSVEKAYASYLDTIPESKRLGSLTYELKDVVGIAGVGIGSAGLPAYSLLVEGHTQALENDVVLTMKQGNVAAPSRVVDDPQAREYFAHHGHRTAVSQKALQAHADPWLGWTELGGVGFVVAEFSPYVADLDWSTVDEPEEMRTVLHQLGCATAKVHCVSDKDTEETPLVDFQTEDAIVDVIGDKDDEFVRDIVDFAFAYREQVGQDHGLFVEAFRNGQIPGVEPTK